MTVVEGLGLVDGAVDVHAAQWGNVSRLVAAVESGLVPCGLALDECTTLLPDGDVAGAGRLWRVTREGGRARGDPFALTAPGSGHSGNGLDRVMLVSPVT